MRWGRTEGPLGVREETTPVEGSTSLTGHQGLRSLPGRTRIDPRVFVWTRVTRVYVLL